MSLRALKFRFRERRLEARWPNWSGRDSRPAWESSRYWRFRSGSDGVGNRRGVEGRRLDER